MTYDPIGVVKFKVLRNRLDNPPTRKFIPQGTDLDQYFSIRFRSPISRPVTDGTTSVLLTCRGWYVQGEWIWGEGKRIMPSDRNRHLIQYPSIPESLANKATLQQLEFDKHWEGYYRRYIDEPNWFLLVDLYIPD